MWYVKTYYWEEYHTIIDDINKLTSNFNSIYERTILSQVEEVAHNANEYYRIQNLLKT